MNFFYSIIFILIFAIGLNAQSFSTNFNVNLNNNDTKSIVELWQSYLKTNSKDFWVERGTKNLANFNVLDMEGILNPSLMNWGFDNRILSINRISENKYLIKSLFEKENKDVFAITNVVAVSYTHLDVYKRQDRILNDFELGLLVQPNEENLKDYYCLLYTSRCV